MSSVSRPVVLNGVEPCPNDCSIRHPLAIQRHSVHEVRLVRSCGSRTSGSTAWRATADLVRQDRPQRFLAGDILLGRQRSTASIALALVRQVMRVQIVQCRRVSICKGIPKAGPPDLPDIFTKPAFMRSRTCSSRSLSSQAVRARERFGAAGRAEEGGGTGLGSIVRSYEYHRHNRRYHSPSACLPTATGEGPSHVVIDQCAQHPKKCGIGKPETRIKVAKTTKLPRLRQSRAPPTSSKQTQSSRQPRKSSHRPKLLGCQDHPSASRCCARITHSPPLPHHDAHQEHHEPPRKITDQVEYQCRHQSTPALVHQSLFAGGCWPRGCI